MITYKYVIRRLRSKRGSAYIQSMVAIVMLMVVIATALETYKVLQVKEGLDNTATEIARYIELRGALNSAVYSEFDRITRVTNVDATLSVDGDFSSGGKLQLEAPFTVTVSGKGRLFEFEIPLQGKATGRSEVYHK